MSGIIEFTPGGLRELSPEGDATPVEVAGMVAVQQARAPEHVLPGIQIPTPTVKQSLTAEPTQPAQSLNLNRRDWVKELRQRKKTLGKAIRQLRGLEVELQEIERLIQAASTPRGKNVRTIDSARRSG